MIVTELKDFEVYAVLAFTFLQVFVQFLFLTADKF